MTAAVQTTDYNFNLESILMVNGTDLNEIFVDVMLPFQEKHWQDNLKGFIEIFDSNSFIHALQLLFGLLQSVTTF